ncbi:MAG TPA: hypothetical protein VK866_17055 [Acidimicrobiales bacterium]|nr:hypothetical protein [Acidimicrobiales bacterium]
MSLRRLLALVFAAALLLAACGDDDGGDDAADAPATTAASDESADTTEADTTDTTEADTTETTEAGGGGGELDGFDFGQFDDICQLANAGEEVGATAFDDIDPTISAPEDLESVFVAADGFLARAAQIAPGDIQPDFQIVSEAFGGLIGVLAEFDFDFFALALEAESNPELIAQLEALDDPRLEEASNNIDAYLQNECGIAPSAP